MMKNKIDIGVFVKKAFESNMQSQQPDKKVLERIHNTLDETKKNKKKLFFWLSFSVLVVGSASYLILDSITSGSQNEMENNTVVTQSIEEFHEFNSEEIIGPLLFTDVNYPNDYTQTPVEGLVYYSLILDTTQTNIKSIISDNVQTIKKNSNYTVDKLFKQKTIYYYYRSSDSLRMETTDKRLIDSILSIENNQTLNDKSL